MLWPLWNRASEVKRRDRLIDDPLAAELVDTIDYPFRKNFGRPSALHAVRARVCDDLIRDYHQGQPESVAVIALGEGLETQLWRLGDHVPNWFSVDVPEAIKVREQLLPAHPKQTLLPYSALDTTWMDTLEKNSAPFISAAGLLMYFQETEVLELLKQIAARFPRGQLYFDTIPPFFSRKTLKGLKVTKHYTAPPMPWGVRLSELPTFIDDVGGWRVAFIKNYGEPFPKRTPIYKLMSQLPAGHSRFCGGLAHLIGAA